MTEVRLKAFYSGPKYREVVLPDDQKLRDILSILVDQIGWQLEDYQLYTMLIGHKESGRCWTTEHLDSSLKELGVSDGDTIYVDPNLPVF